jgi:hypothetical protein
MSKNFYADIGSILDARAGVIKRINPEVYAELVRKNYHTRKGDFFEGIDPVVFRDMYETYDVENLIEGTLTNVFHFLYPQVTEAMKEFVAHEAQDHMRPVLDVNFWPYDVSDDEMAVFRTIIWQKMRGIIGVNVFRRDIKELTPGYCAENYHMMITYDYHHYLNAHATELIRSPKPFLIMIAPMVYFNTDPDKDEETIEQLNQGINSLALLEATLAPRICLKFVNVDIFSIVYPDDRVLKVDVVDTESGLSLDDLGKILAQQDEKRIPEA